MIYGNKFYNYGVEPASVLESDINCFNNLLNEFCIDESMVIKEAVNIKETINKAFSKIKGFFIKVLETINNILDFIHGKLTGYTNKLLEALKKQKEVVGESAVVTEAEENEQEVVVYALSGEGLMKVHAYQVILTELASKLMSFMHDMQNKSEDLVKKGVDNATARKILGEETDKFYEKFSDRYEECEDIIDFIQDADKSKIFDEKKFTIDTKSKKGVSELIDEIDFVQKEIKKYTEQYKDFEGFVKTIKKSYFDPVEEVYNDMAKAASNSRNQKNWQKEMDVDKAEFDFQYKYISTLYSYTNQYYTLTSKGITSTLAILGKAFSSNAKLIKTVGGISTIKAFIKVDVPKMND